MNRFFTLLLTLLLVACGSTLPKIVSFKATPNSLTAGGGNVTLSWDVSGATGISINQSVGTVTGTSIVVHVTSSKTFTLSATNASGTTTADAAVTVATIADTTAPTIASISPASGATGVSKDTSIVITFSEAMKKTETQGAYQSSSSGIQPANVTFEWNTEGTVLTIKPKAPLAYATGTDPNTVTAPAYAFNLTDTAVDLAGNKLAPVNSSFKTLRQITARLIGDPAQDGGVDGATVNNGNIDFQVGFTSRGFLGYKLDSLPAGLQDTSLVAATLRVNAEFPTVFSGQIIELEHLLYGATLISSAYGTTALRKLDNLSEQEPKFEGWKIADVLVAAKDDLKNRIARGNRSQYRLRCLNCTAGQSVTLIAAEAKDTAGSFKDLVPQLVIEYVLP